MPLANKCPFGLRRRGDKHSTSKAVSTSQSLSETPISAIGKYISASTFALEDVPHWRLRRRVARSIIPIIDAAHTIRRHWHGILRWFHSRIANGLIEGINSLVQAAKAKARGYRSMVR